MEDLNIEEYDLESYSSEGKVMPESARKFLIKIDKKKYKWPRIFITGKEILELVGKDPTKNFVNQKFRFGRVEIVELDEKVDLLTCGVEKFVTVPLDQTEGRPNRAFSLPSDDQEFLESMDYKWDATKEGNKNWTIIRDFELPIGYNVEKVDIAILISPAYPVTQLDMVYVYPKMGLLSGKKINALAELTIEGKRYQRWSRHRTALNPWRPGVDDISTHISLINHWFKREIDEKVG